MRKVGLGETGGTTLKVRGRPQGGRNVLQGGGSSGPTVWIEHVGNFGSNVEEGGRDAHRVPHKYLREESLVGRIQYVGHTRFGRSARGSGNKVGNDLHREMTGNRGTVGGATTTIRSVCKGEGI